MRNETITTGGYTSLTQFKDVTITVDSSTPYCANVASAIHTLVGIVTNAVDPNIGTVPTRTIARGALYSVSNFKIARNGYAFAPGDVVKVVGLVTAKGFTEPVEDFKLEVTQTFNDFFAAWSFGEMDYIDSIAAYQDGTRTRFPIYYENNLLSLNLILQVIFLVQSILMRFSLSSLTASFRLLDIHIHLMVVHHSSSQDHLRSTIELIFSSMLVHKELMLV